MGSKIKVLHIIEAFGSGVLNVLQVLVNNMGEEYEQYVLYGLREESPNEPEKIFRHQVNLIRAKHLVRKIKFVEDMQAIIEVRRIFHDIQPDLVQLYSSKAGAIGRLALNGNRIPVFYSPQGYSFLMSNCSAIKRKLYYVLEKACGCRPSVTVASCKGEYDTAKKVSKRAVYINNGIDITELDRFNLNVDSRPKKIRICTLGRIVSQKDPDMFNRIAEFFPDNEFVWIGDGELAEKLSSPNIEVTGWMTKREALNKLLDSSIFILTSQYEGCSFALIEAMYLKRCCIVSRIPGNVDAIKDGKTGYICGTFEEYVNVISKLQKDGIDKKMVEAAHSRVLNELNQRVMVERYEQLYKKTMGFVSGSEARGGIAHMPGVKMK